MVGSRVMPHAAKLATAAVVLSLLSLLVLARPVAAVQADLFVDLTGAAEVPGPGDPDGAGTALVYLDSDAGQLCYALFVENIATATVAHIHPGAAGEANPPVITLTAPADGSSGGCVDADPAVLEDIAANPAAYYVNVHNDEFQNGAIRGQLQASETADLCFLVAAVDPGPDTEGSVDLDVTVGQELTFWGYFVPDATVNLNVFIDGVEFGDWTPATADAEGYVEFLFTPDRPGDWGVEAGVADTICAAGVELTVSAAAAPTPAPSQPSSAPPAAPVLPDTASRGGEAPAEPALLALLLASGVTVVAVVRRRIRG